MTDENNPDSILDALGFAPPFGMGGADWSAVPDTPGVYVLFDQDEIVYVGMAGRDQKGSLRRRLRDHASGQIVNMFAQYLLFARLLVRDDRPKTPRQAALECRAYIRARCSARFLSLADKAEAVKVERMLRQRLQPAFNHMEKTAVPGPIAEGSTS
ncbi:MAG TPA: hypothetical protein PK694_08235 [Rhodospirillales bacterium]|nr:hypothetical protein [Rhodospirillales bacterium]